MVKHGWSTSYLARDPVQAVDEFRSEIGVEVTRNYFLYDRQASDEPRSAHVALSLRGSDPEAIRAVLHDVGQAVLAEQAAHRTNRLAQSRQLVESQVQQVRARLKTMLDAAAASRDGAPPGGGAVSAARAQALRMESRALLEQLARLEQARGQLSFAATAEDADLGLTFELYDERVQPLIAPLSRRRLAALLVVTFTIVLALATLVIGAFDDRVCCAEDLEAGGFATLSVVGRFPGDEVGSHRARLQARGV
jgi:hypothetical protein